MIILCGTKGCIGFTSEKIGFVLHKKEAICRGFSTDVEGRRQKAEGRRQKTEDRIQKTEDRRWISGGPGSAILGILGG